MIRRAEIDDFKVIKHFEDELLKMHRLNRPDIFIDGDPLPYELYQRKINDDRFIYLVYEEDDKVIGYITASYFEYRNELLKPLKGFHINEIYVEEDMRHKGIGHKLIKTLEDMIKENGIDRLELSVWAFNAEAIKFYDHIGFSIKNYALEKKI